MLAGFFGSKSFFGTKGSVLNPSNPLGLPAFASKGSPLHFPDMMSTTQDTVSTMPRATDPVLISSSLFRSMGLEDALLDFPPLPPDAVRFPKPSQAGHSKVRSTNAATNTADLIGVETHGLTTFFLAFSLVLFSFFLFFFSSYFLLLLSLALSLSPLTRSLSSSFSSSFSFVQFDLSAMALLYSSHPVLSATF